MLMLEKDGQDIILQWLEDQVASDYIIRRSSDPTNAGAFLDVTIEDGQPTDTLFRDRSDGSPLFWIVQGNGPKGGGLWGHYSR